MICMVQCIRAIKVQDAYMFDGGKVTPKINSKISLSEYHPKPQIVFRGVMARIDCETMQRLGISTGDIIEIKGKNKTIVKCLPLYPSDEGKGIIRMDSAVRSNSSVNINDKVSIKVIKPVAAKKIEGRLMESCIYYYSDMKDSLVSITLMEQEIIKVPYFTDWVEIVIEKIVPNPVAIVTKNTKVSINPAEYGN